MILEALCVALLRAQDPWPPAPPLVLAADSPGARALALPRSVEAEPLASGRFRCTFRFLADERAESVALAGSFNAWSPTATLLSRGADGRLQAQVELDGGVHAYKFVLDGARWLRDPANPEGADDGHGGANSVVRLGRIASLGAARARAGDGALEGAALEHAPARPLYLQRLAGERVLLRYRTLAGDAQAVALALRGRASLPMGRALAGATFDYWEVVLPAEELEYTFVIVDGDLRVSHPSTYRLERADALFTTPEWSKHAIWYQVMLDRFRNGSRDNDPEPVRRWTSDWYEPADFEKASGESFWQWFVFRRLYGGDLQGLTERLDYLADLGVNALYLNPIFQARSHHKYDATSYVHVDEHFGVRGDYAPAEAVEDLLDPSTWTFTPTDRLFLELVAQAHARGFKVILDGVFNHVGTAHPAFRDVAARGRESRFADWFDVRSWSPFRYEGWAGFGELPVFKKASEGFASRAVERHVFEVTRRWMDPDGDGDPRDGIDGWRLDVPNEIAMPFWQRWRAHVKAINPDAYIAGEIWTSAGEWLDGRHFDAVMNYPFARIALAWIGDRQRKISAGECDRRLAELRLAYPSEATYALMNLVDSHDTDRLVSMLANPDRDYDQQNREQDGAKYDGSKPGEREYRRARLVALLQMTYVGAPMIYYGDEVGMWGADDPTNRKPMLWRDLEPYDAPRENAVMAEHLAHYERAVGLRRAHSALRTGSFRTLVADDESDVLVFVREDERESVIVALNASERLARVALPELGEGYEAVWGEEARARERVARIPALDGRVWVRRR